MRIPMWLTALAAVIGLGVMLVLGSMIIQPDVPLIIRADFEAERITPDADGDNDITTFAYELSRNADVTLTLEDDTGNRYDFRRDEPRIAQDYRVLFSGVVEGFTLPDEDIPGMVERRLIPDGVYTWRFVAENESEREEISGTLEIDAGDIPLPVMTVFEVSPEEFTPNQDGVNDRVEVNVYLEKDVEDLRVFLVDDTGDELEIAERKEGREENEAGRHIFDYAGGVDLGADPPPDGTYTVVGVAQDAVGQRVRQTDTLTINLGGKPRAEIVPQSVGRDVYWEVAAYDDDYFSDADAIGERLVEPGGSLPVDFNTLTVPLGDMIIFRLTVENYSDTPIRTTGPAPGTVYQQDQLASSLRAYEEPGAWRVGVQCDSFLSSTQPFPYRWALGTDDDLITIADPDTGREFMYLPAGERAEVWGAVRIIDIDERQNPQTCWAGLIHEGVGITVRNARVGPIEVNVVPGESEGEQ